MVLSQPFMTSFLWLMYSLSGVMRMGGEVNNLTQHQARHQDGNCGVDGYIEALYMCSGNTGKFCWFCWSLTTYICLLPV